MLFQLGHLLITPAAEAVVPTDRVSECLKRHLQGDWGSIPPEDVALNNEALKSDGRLLSVYGIEPSGPSDMFWIITEADRSSTTILLPEDY